MSPSISNERQPSKPAPSHVPGEILEIVDALAESTQALFDQNKELSERNATITASFANRIEALEAELPIRPNISHQTETSESNESQPARLAFTTSPHPVSKIGALLSTRHNQITPARLGAVAAISMATIVVAKFGTESSSISGQHNQIPSTTNSHTKHLAQSAPARTEAKTAFANVQNSRNGDQANFLFPSRRTLSERLTSLHMHKNKVVVHQRHHQAVTRTTKPIEVSIVAANDGGSGISPTHPSYSGGGSVTPESAPKLHHQHVVSGGAGTSPNSASISSTHSATKLHRPKAATVATPDGGQQKCVPNGSGSIMKVVYSGGDEKDFYYNKPDCNSRNQINPPGF